MNFILRARLFDIKFGPFRFNPGIWSTVLAIGIVYFMITMAFWQLSRAEFKDDLLQKISERKDLAPVSLSELPHTVDESVFMPVRVSGNFDEEHQFLYDNRILNGIAGYHVYTPLLLVNGQAILVNRGWLPLGKTRNNLPDLRLKNKFDVEFTGLIDKPPSKGFLLSDSLHTNVNWPLVLQYIDIKEIESFLGYELLPMVIWMDSNAENIYEHVLPVLKLDSSKNRGYTFQWFAMAITIVILYIVLNIHKVDEK